MIGSTPNLSEFNPHLVPYQYDVIRDIRRNYDYDLGTHEILLSGAVGSAKTLLMSHIAVTHCLINKQATFGIGRLTLPALKKTLMDVILKHCDESVDVVHNKSSGEIRFPNGSIILPFSWRDRNYRKFRSYEFSGFAVEELTENHDLEFYRELRARVGRVRHIKEKIVINATNPDDPAHEAYKYFITSDNPRRHVYYSKTRDNRLLPDSYVESLEALYDEKMAKRMLEGEWLSIAGDVIYYNYDPARNYLDKAYKVNPNYDIKVAFDFNIGEGKPMSCALYQHIDGVFHFFEQSVIHGGRTPDVIEDLHGRGLFRSDQFYRIRGDSSGRNRDTRGPYSDYDVIARELSNRGIKFVIEVPKANPFVRKRHNLMNGQMRNMHGNVNFLVYNGCKTLDEGCRLTKLKPGGHYIEDDNPHYQHITTAVGYGVYWDLMIANSTKSKTIRF